MSSTDSQRVNSSVDTLEEYGSCSSSSLLPPIRPANRRRRASQPALLSTSRRRRGFSTRISSDSEGWSSLSSSGDSEVESDSDDEVLFLKLSGWDRKGKAREGSLEYLDLPLSLPLTIVSMRNSLLSYLAAMELRARSISARLRSDSGAASSPDFLTPFYLQLELLREDLCKVALLLPDPRSSPAFAMPASLAHPQAAFVAKFQSLAADWDRLSSAAMSTQIALPGASFFGDADPRRLAIDLPNLLSVPHMPTLMGKMQSRFESLHEMVATMSLRECWEQSELQQQGSAAMFSAASSLPSWDNVTASIRESSSKGAAKASEAAASLMELEQAMYARACELAGQGSKLIEYTDLPQLWRNNEYILTAYRFIPLENWTALLKSSFQVHNETINIHSHLAGVIVVLPLFWPSKGLDPHTTWADRLVQTIYLIAAMKCLVSSIVWHIFAGCSNAKWFERAACIDYSGVALLVAASVWTTIYNEFYCQPNLAMLYSLTTLIVGITGAVVPWAAWFNERKNKGLRICVFLGMCFTSLAPFFHSTYEHGFFKTLKFLNPIIPSLLCYIGGLVLYATNFPERVWPGRFDIVGQAHQFWHLAIVAAILLHYRAALAFHEKRFEFSCTNNAYKAGETPSFFTPFVPMIDSIGTKLSSLADRVISHPPAHGVEALNRADEVIYGWRIVAGSLAGGAVGRAWNRSVEFLSSYFG